MADNTTVNSRLRILVAKAFRAEKLYGSMRSDVGRAGPGLLSEIANETRAKEWQKVHRELRSNLNDILSGESSSSKVLSSVATLKRRFEKRAEDAQKAVDQSLAAMLETANRGEFVHSLKLSFELIRLKAAAQANNVVVEELLSALQGGGAILEEEQQEEEELPAPPSNVIPFRASRGR